MQKNRERLARFHPLHISVLKSFNENADPLIRQDVEGCISTIVTFQMTGFYHYIGGDNDSPAHIRASPHGSYSLVLQFLNGQTPAQDLTEEIPGKQRNNGGLQCIVAMLTT